MTVVDKYDLTGKIAAPTARYDLVVVGAGLAGTQAACDAAITGQHVLLIDENPVAGSAMGNDTPLFFGGSMTAAVQNSGRMVEQVFVSNPALEAAMDAGVEVLLGTVAWGLYRNGPAMQTLPEPMLGLADAERAWMVGFDRLVLATGARDLVLGFAGWNQPGVMGAQGFHTLVTRYAAFAGQQVLILGSGALALETALLAHANGIAVAGLVECLDAVQGPADLADAVRAAGIVIYVGCAIAATRSGVDGVTGALVGTLGNDTVAEVVCDTIVLAIGTVPATELLAAGGIAPDDTILLTGDAAAPPPDMAYVAAWATALGSFASPDTIVCQCEEVTRADLLGVQPPQYLARPAPMAARSLATLAADGPAHPDQIKRLTRAGMGTCQGRRCREQVACLLADATGVPVARVPVASYRAPVRPIPLGVLADWDEGEAMIRGWDVWFGIPTQWTPYALIGTPGEAEHVSIVGGYSHV